MIKIQYIFLFLSVTVLVFSSCSVFKFAKIYTSSDKKDGKLFGDVYKKKDTSYRIGNLGDSWKRVSIDYGDIFFANNNKTAAVTVDSTCDENKANYSLSALSGSLLIGIKGKKLLEREKISIDGEDALFSLYEAQVDNDRLKIATAIFTKESCIYDFSYTNIGENFDYYLKDFIQFLENFTVLEG